jgi:hypothetical protein
MRYQAAVSSLGAGAALAATLVLGCGVARAQTTPRSAGEQNDPTMAPAEEARDQRLKPRDAPCPDKVSAQAEKMSPSEIAVAAADKAAEGADQPVVTVWSVYIEGLPRPSAPRGPSFGAGLGGSDAFELGPLPGVDLGAWSPRYGIGPRAFQGLSGPR